MRRKKQNKNSTVRCSSTKVITSTPQRQVQMLIQVDKHLVCVARMAPTTHSKHGDTPACLPNTMRHAFPYLRPCATYSSSSRALPYLIRTRTPFAPFQSFFTAPSRTHNEQWQLKPIGQNSAACILMLVRWVWFCASARVLLLFVLVVKAALMHGALCRCAAHTQIRW